MKKDSKKFGTLKIKSDICNRFEREVLRKEGGQEEVRKIILKKDSEKFGALKIKLDICNRFEREVRE